MQPHLETERTNIPLFDKSAANGLAGQVFLCAPKRMYYTPFYHNLARRIAKLHPDSEILLAHNMYFTSDHWRETYREKLAHVEVCYTLTDLSGYIGAGQFAELAFMCEPKHPLRRHVAARPSIDAILCNRLKLLTDGRFELLENWDFWRCAKFTRRRIAPAGNNFELSPLPLAA